MQLEVSTLNVLLTVTIGLQCWIVKRLMSLDHRLTKIETAMGLDTGFLRKAKNESHRSA